MEFDQDLVVTMVSALGLVTFLKSLLGFARWVWIMFLRPPKNLKEQYGTWALVTGPTDGIGKAVALELAAKGLNLVLVGRNPARLADVAGLLVDAGVQVRTVVVDLAERSGKEIREAVERATEGLDVGVVVNNAGLAYPYAQFFDEVGMDLVMDIVRVNVEAATWVTMAVLPRMLERKRGVVVNIGSAAADVFPSFPLYAVYAASKAYISMFSKCLSVEYKKSGIDFQCQVPIAVATKMTRVKAHSILVASPETYAKASVRSIGFETLCAPYWSHSAQWFAISFLPDWLVDRCVYAYFVRINKRVKLRESRNKRIDPKRT